MEEEKANITPSVDAETVEKVAANPEVRKVNRLARLAFFVSVLAWVCLFGSAGVEATAVSNVLMGGAVLLSVVGFVMGFISLWRSPRGFSTGALVFSGVIVLIVVLTLFGFKLLSELPGN